MALSSIMTGALLSANTSRQIAHVQSAVKTRMDGHAGVLDAEIKLDSARGGDVTKKKEELEETQKKAAELAETTINTLTTANEDLKKASKEQLFYEGNMILKYMTVVPAVFMFLVTTNPSELAASLNKIGVHYNVGYALSIALRYIPDVQKDFAKIRNAQAARGIEMSNKAGLLQRIKNVSAILFPLIFTSMDRIDVVSNAMELRGFGKYRKRTWYSSRPLQRNDYLVIVFIVVFTIAAFVITFWDGSRFYNPFV